MSLTPRSHRVQAPDGWILDVAEVGDRGGAGPVVVAGHAMMVDRRTLLRPERPCLVRTLVEHGHLVLVPDLRGHGKSGPTPAEGGEWTYDQLVADVAVYLELARSIAPGRPVIVVGHSLFGHNALAYVGLRPRAGVAGIVLIAADVWLPQGEPSRLHWAMKVGLLAFSEVAASVLGKIPVRRFRLGTADEPHGYWRWFWPLTSGRWRADDGIDYAAAVRRVRCPVLHVVSQGDRLYARPASALHLTRDLPQRDILELGASGDPELDALRPNHIPIVTDPGCAPVWDRIASWIDAVGSQQESLDPEHTEP